MWLAHSARKDPPVPPESYCQHVSKVTEQVTVNLGAMLQYYSGDHRFFTAGVLQAATFHDLGKLDDKNQSTLLQNDSRHLPVNHVDAGAAYLLENDLIESALLVYSHHVGLPSIPLERGQKGELFLRDPKTVGETNERLQTYLRRHAECGLIEIDNDSSIASDWSGLTRRLALSCLVDADHGDTAQNYGKEFRPPRPALKWKQRLEALDRYVEGLGKNHTASQERNALRRKIYDACRNADTSPSFYACDSPVGTGKTTAVMAHLLRAAIDKKLRHVIVVLPYTNIIRQSVEVYRDALVLSGEVPEEIVVEHHHQADFSAIEVRQLATLWAAPIIVTTAVQFFETIANNEPSRLRKLHELPGCAVFVDECHAAIPNFLWPQTWRWLRELDEKWHCHFVLGSGSLPRFWELKNLILKSDRIPQLVSNDLREVANGQERKRIVPIRHPHLLNVDGLLDLTISRAGPRVIIMNTVQSAAVVAHALATRLYGEKYTIDLSRSRVLHLSTALAPVHRDRVVDAVKKRLGSAKRDEHSDFTLVATSCVEAGVDFSFRAAFRERAGTANLIQVGGRVRRHGEDFEGLLLDFRIEDNLINRHPAFDLSSEILERLFVEDRVATSTPSDIVTEALRRELMSGIDGRQKMIQKCEDALDYPAVGQLYRVIASETQTILVDEETIDKVCRGDRVSPQEINRMSVQMWTNKVGKTCAYEIKGYPGLHGWPPDQYDEVFLGYMKGMLPLLRLETEGLEIV